jgi:hypothetical protein
MKSETNFRRANAMNYIKITNLVYYTDVARRFLLTFLALVA